MERTILPDGTRIETLAWGDGEPRACLLHEGLGSARLWRGFGAALAARLGGRVVAWSRAGYGASDPCPLPRPPDYLQREARDVLPRLLDAAGVRRVILLGHSDGASIAAIHGGDDPRIAGLVLVAPHVVAEDITRQGCLAARVAYEAGDLRGRLARHHAAVDVAFYGWNDCWSSEQFHAGFDLMPEVRRIARPVLAIQGEADQYGTPAQISLIADAAPVPVETLLIPGIGHAPHLEAEALVLDAVAAFAARVLPG